MKQTLVTWLSSCYTEHMAYKHDKNVFTFIQQNPGTDGLVISERLEIPYVSVKTVLNRLIESNLIVRHRRRLFIKDGVTQYVEVSKERSLPQRVGIRTPGVFRKPEIVTTYFEDIVSIGKVALKIKASGRDLNTEKVPYTDLTFKQYFDQLQALINEVDMTFYYELMLISQMLQGNLEFFTLFEDQPFPTESTARSIIRTLVEGKTDEDR